MSCASSRRALVVKGFEMELDIEEFTARLDEIVDGRECVTVTNEGRVIGQYTPFVKSRLRLAAQRSPAEDATRAQAVQEWTAKRDEHREAWKARTPDWEKRMPDYGLTPDGEPLV